MQALNLPEYEFQFKEDGSKSLIFDEIRRKYILLTPEEWVRQNFIKYLINQKGYPASLIATEMPFVQNIMDKRSDIVIYNKQGRIIVLVECKAYTVQLSQKVFDQAAGYNLKLNAEILIITNGKSHYCCKPDYENRKWLFLDGIPSFVDLNSICID
jgi:hypothetical protein